MAGSKGYIWFQVTDARNLCPVSCTLLFGLSSMKSFFLFLFLFVLLLITVTVQDLFPSLLFFGQAHLLFFPIIFCFAVLALPFSEALFFGMITGLIEGLMIMHIHDGHVEIRLGWFILFFMLWALALQLLSNLTDGVRWELHALGSGLCTATFLLGEFFLLSCSRGHFLMTGEVLLMSVLPAGAAFLLAPCFYGLLQFLLCPPKRINTSYPLPL